MIIVGLDMATQTGVCYGRPDTTPHAESVRAPVTGKDLGEFGAFYWNYYNQLFERLALRLQPGETITVCYEAPILPGQTNLSTTRKLHGLGVLLETAIRLHAAPISVYECHLSSIKKELTGKGGADKGMMVLAARRAGIDLPQGSEAMDAADAFAAWLIAVRLCTPEHQRLWDQRIWGGKVWQN